MAQVDQSPSTLKGSARDAGVIQTGLVIYFEQETHRLEKPRWACDFNWGALGYVGWETLGHSPGYLFTAYRSLKM